MTRVARVVYWNNIPSPYMVERFNALARRGGLDLEVWFNDRIEPGRTWTVDEKTWEFRYRFMPKTRLFGRTFHWPLLHLTRKFDIIVSLYAEPVFVFGWLLSRLKGAKTAFRVLLTHDRWISRHAVKDAVKRFLFRRVDAIETPGQDGKRFAMHYGVSPDRIFIARHTVDIPHFKSGFTRARIKRECLRNGLGLRGVTFLYVGRLWWGKGVNYLLEAFLEIQHQCTLNVDLLLLGDGPEEFALRQKCVDLDIRNVTFGGFKQKADLPTYYAIADVFVFPTLGDPYGLVVDEAMVCSLPIISTSAAGEIRDRVEDGVNGYIVPPEDSSALAENMLKLANDPDLRQRMGNASLSKIEGHTPENWAKDFMRLVQTLTEGGK